MKPLVLAATVMLLSGCGLQTDRTASGGAVQITPSPAPELSGKTTAGGQFALSASRGHPVVVDFFGSWCGPCRAGQPDLNSIATRYQARGVEFVGVAMRDDSTAVRGYEQTYKVPYPAMLDDGSLAASYDIAAPPTIVVVDSHGNIVSKFLATTTGLASKLDALLLA